MHLSDYLANCALCFWISCFLSVSFVRPPTASLIQISFSPFYCITSILQMLCSLMFNFYLFQPLVFSGTLKSLIPIMEHRTGFWWVGLKQATNCSSLIFEYSTTCEGQRKRKTIMDQRLVSTSSSIKIYAVKLYRNSPTARYRHVLWR